MNKTYAVIENGIVTNLVIWDGNPNSWTPPAGAVLVEYTAPKIGDAWDGANFTPTDQPAGPVP